jgi:hypothetical protein
MLSAFLLILGYSLDRKCDNFEWEHHKLNFLISTHYKRELEFCGIHVTKLKRTDSQRIVKELFYTQLTKNRQVYARVTFLKNAAQIKIPEIEHKIPF